jgi:nicotinamide-nucleotide amidase
MNASILSIGDEIVLGQTLDTNGAWLAGQLLDRSVAVVEHRTVPDDRAAIAGAVDELAARSDLLVITGGLGPTEDDLTRVGLGDVVAPGRDLVVDERAERTLRRWFRDREMPASNLVQAQRPETMQSVPNPHGTAPGLRGRHHACDVFALPGPPREMKPMFLENVLTLLDEAEDRDRVVTERVLLYGLGESWAAERLGDLISRADGALMVGTTASSGIITARVRAVGAEATAERLVAEAVDRIEAAWAPYCFGRGSTTLAAAVGALLETRSATLVTAESCTGGWLGKTIVDTPGASAYYRGGWVTYDNGMKADCLGVPAALLETHGAVSVEAASAMAAGALERADADASIALTGIAGPDGGVPGKPAGTVIVAVGRRDRPPVVRTFRYRGGRDVVRDRSVKSALQMLRFAMLDVPDDQPLIWSREPGESS